jgi:hypothetical protein
MYYSLAPTLSVNAIKLSEGSVSTLSVEIIRWIRLAISTLHVNAIKLSPVVGNKNTSGGYNISPRYGIAQ